MTTRSTPKRPRAFTIRQPADKPNARPVLRFRGHRLADSIGRHDVAAALRSFDPAEVRL